MEIKVSNIKSLNCSETLKGKLTAYVTDMADILGENLLGLYLYGSLARGCFNSVTSDVDVIAVTKEQCKENDIPEILQVHRNAGVSIDAVFVTEAQMLADVFPTPVEFLIKPIDDGTIIRIPEGIRDFLLQRQDAHEAGIVLAESTSRDLLHPVPWPLLAQCLDYLFPHIVPNFKNSVLMLCRIAYAWTHHKLCCKRIAGKWAFEAFGGEWREIVSAALAEYAGGVVGVRITADAVRAFEEFCADSFAGTSGVENIS